MAQPLTDAINALTTYANTVTGKTPPDTTLSDAVATLASGYGGGGSANDIIEHNVSGAVTSTASSLSNFSYIGQPITSVDLPNITNLKTVNDNTSAGSDFLFAYCANLTSFSAPKATNVGDNLLKNDTVLVSVNMDALTDCGSDFCNGCTSLQTIVLPSVKVIYARVFRGCTNLETVDVLASTGFTNQNNFNGCTKLTKLIIRKNGVATLSNINNFTGTPFASSGTGGEIYVPSAQISAYQSSNNWSTLNGYGTVTWKAIEGSYYETHYADGRTIE